MTFIVAQVEKFGKTENLLTTIWVMMRMNLNKNFEKIICHLKDSRKSRVHVFIKRSDPKKNYRADSEKRTIMIELQITSVNDG